MEHVAICYEFDLINEKNSQEDGCGEAFFAFSFIQIFTQLTSFYIIKSERQIA